MKRLRPRSTRTDTPFPYTAVVRSSPGGANIGVNFAIPADAAIPVIEALRAGETPQRGYLGIGIVPVSEDMAAALGLSKDRGEIVQRIEDGQAAAKAGLKRGDVVTKITGKEITPQQSLSYIFPNIPPSTRVDRKSVLNGKHVAVSVDFSRVRTTKQKH